MRTKLRVAITCGVAGLASLVYTALASGAEWSLTPFATVGSFYDTNPALSTGPSDDSTGAYLTAGLGSRYATELSKVDLGAVWLGTRYVGGAFEDSDESLVALDSSSRVTERQTLGLVGEWRRSSLYQQRAQTGDGGTGDIRDTDVGLARVRRDYWWLRPEWFARLSELNSLRLRYRRTEANYDEILSDYQEDLLVVEWLHRLSPRDNLSLGVRGSSYRSPDADSSATTGTLFIGVNRAFTATSRGGVYVGGARSVEESGTAKFEQTGYVVSADYQQRTELTRLRLELSRDVHPSGGGRLVGSDQVRMDLRQATSTRSEFWLRLLAFRDRVLEGEDPALDRTYAELEPGWQWSWTPELGLEASYQYRMQKREVDSETAQSSAVYVGLGYTWPKASVSR